jgi:zinc transporter ZupT
VDMVAIAATGAVLACDGAAEGSVPEKAGAAATVAPSLPAVGLSVPGWTPAVVGGAIINVPGAGVAAGWLPPIAAGGIMPSAVQEAIASMARRHAADRAHALISRPAPDRSHP